MLEKGTKKKETSRRFEGKKSEIGRGHLEECWTVLINLLYLHFIIIFSLT